MQRTKVESSNIVSIGYADGVLEVEFVGGSVYQYRGPVEKIKAAWEGIMKAESKGKYFTAHIRRDPEISHTRVDKK